MRRFLLAAIILATTLAPSLGHAQGDPQSVVDRSTLALQEMMTQDSSHDPQMMLQRARAVIICPRVFKAGFIVGGSGGACVLLARAGNGTWSYPAFYSIGSGSVGFQLGIEDSAVVMMIMTQRGLNAVLDAQFKLGADASVAAATVGGGVGGATTAAVGADIVVFAQSRGLFAGVSLEGSLMSLRSDLIGAYYGQPYSAYQIVVQMAAANPGANPLREILTRYGSAPTMQTGEPPPPPPNGPPGAPPQASAGYAPGYNGPAYPSGNAPGYPSGNAPAYPSGNAPGYAPAYPPADQGNSGYGNQSAPSQPVQQQPLAPPGR